MRTFCVRTRGRLQCSGSQRVVPGPAAAVAPGHLLEMHVLRLQPRPTESETQLEVESDPPISFRGDSDALKCEMPGEVCACAVWA